MITHAYLEYATGPNRTLTAARLALFVEFVEASHNPALREPVSHRREVMRSWVSPVLARLGAREPHIAAESIMACCEGILLHRIARGDRT